MPGVVSRALHGRAGGFHVLADPGHGIAGAHQQRGGEQGKEDEFAHLRLQLRWSLFVALLSLWEKDQPTASSTASTSPPQSPPPAPAETAHPAVARASP